MTSPLDQLVKGAAPASNVRASTPEPLNPTRASTHSDSASLPRSSTPDPLAALPSAPPQIYLNLLILEASLRAQYLALRERRRQNTFFLLVLAAWIAYFAYALFLRPREDGQGVGGSVYWVIEMGEKVALLGGVVTALLVWGTGQWERGIRWPRRWLAVANRGLRVMNTKIIVIRGPWWHELFSYISFLFPFSAPFFPSPTGNFHLVERHTSEKHRGSRQHYQQYYNGGDSESGLVEEDLSAGGDYVRLLLLPKSFSPEFRENWEDYRTEFWEKENERRAQLRHKLRERERQLAQAEGGWLWRLGLGWRASQRRRLVSANLHKPLESEHTKQRPGSHHHHHASSVSSKLIQEHRAPLATRRGTRSESVHSRGSSRSSTPVDLEDRPPSRSSASGRPRRGSTTPSISSPEATPQQRKRKGSKTLRRGLSPLTQAQVREGVRLPSFSSDDSAATPLSEKDVEPFPAALSTPTP
ncbi:Sporulation/nuclear morphology, Spo7 family protein [Penicillium ucsense]|uniref:Sporulation/nuclear morphology, Spo7 family protein n=1 Tax=Penicillium ucsense TaxID=2839758 RepID=A0A8J8WDD0_9EURO|nr:Sporulation/nuclear morphology, Spo7 family protein [Penicillium ucsense]KAF7737116.1 Sporulation/nuclear morphology, Spo7 family protein [Penicillium ucsense]